MTGTEGEERVRGGAEWADGGGDSRRRHLKSEEARSWPCTSSGKPSYSMKWRRRPEAYVCESVMRPVYHAGGVAPPLADQRTSMRVPSGMSSADGGAGRVGSEGGGGGCGAASCR
eukprot:scaffold35773_cov197-Isochrysis_galbana.AAC.1